MTAPLTALPAGQGDADVCVASALALSLPCRALVPHQTHAHIPTPETSPHAREGHTLVVLGSRLILYGGTDGRSVFGDVWTFHTQSARWERMVCGGREEAAGARCGHTAVLWGESMIVFGGVGEVEEGQPRGEVVALDLVHQTWRVLVSASGVPPTVGARKGHSAIMFGGKMFVFGGVVRDGSRTNTVGVFDVQAECWEPSTKYNGSAAVPPACSGHSSTLWTTWDSGDAWMIAFGGRCGVKSGDAGGGGRVGGGLAACSADTWGYNLQSYTWHQLRTVGGGPTPRAGHSAIIYNDNLVVFGGYAQRKRGLASGNQHRHEGGRSQRVAPPGLCFALHMPSLSWRRVAMAGPLLPLPRCGHSGVLLQMDGLAFVLLFGGWAEQRAIAGQRMPQRNQNHTPPREAYNTQADQQTSSYPPTSRSLAFDGGATWGGSAGDGILQHAPSAPAGGRPWSARTRSPSPAPTPSRSTSPVMRRPIMALPPPTAGGTGHVPSGVVETSIHCVTDDFMALQLITETEAAMGRSGALVRAACRALPLFPPAAPQAPRPSTARSQRSPATQYRNFFEYQHKKSDRSTSRSRSRSQSRNKKDSPNANADEVGEAAPITIDDLNDTALEGSLNTSPRRPFLNSTSRSPGIPALEDIGIVGPLLSPRRVNSLVNRLYSEAELAEQKRQVEVQNRDRAEVQTVRHTPQQVETTVDRLYYAERDWRTEREKWLYTKWLPKEQAPKRISKEEETVLLQRLNSGHRPSPPPTPARQLLPQPTIDATVQRLYNPKGCVKPAHGSPQYAE